MKKKLKINEPSKNQFVYFAVAILVILVGFTIALLNLNARINNLELITSTFNNATIKTSTSTTQPNTTSSMPNNLTPVCQQSSVGMSTSGGSGEAITSINGNDLTTGGNPGVTFHLCDNVKIYDVVSGKALDQSAMKVGAKVWIKTTQDGYIKEVQIVPE